MSVAQVYVHVEGDAVDVTLSATVEGLGVVHAIADLLDRHAARARPEVQPDAVYETEVIEDPEFIAPEPERPPVRKQRPQQAAPKRTKPAPAKTGRADSDSGVRLLRALHELGGEVFDPSGRATAKLTEAAELEVSQRRVTVLLGVLADSGHITRTVNGKRTSRISLTSKGLAVIDGQQPEPEPEPAVPVPVPDPPQTSTSAGVAGMCLSGQHALCAAVPGKCACSCHGQAGG